MAKPILGRSSAMDPSRICYANPEDDVLGFGLRLKIVMRVYIKAAIFGDGFEEVGEADKAFRVADE